MLRERYRSWCLALAALAFTITWMAPTAEAAVTVEMTTAPTGTVVIASNPNEPAPGSPVVATAAGYTQDGFLVTVLSAAQSYTPTNDPNAGRIATTTITLENTNGFEATATFDVIASFINAGILPFPGRGRFDFTLTSDRMDAGTEIVATSSVDPVSGGPVTLGPLTLTGPIPPPQTTVTPGVFVDVLGQSFTLSQTLTTTMAANTTINFVMTSELTAAPEPGTLVMALTALVPLGVMGLRRFRRRSETAVN